MGRRQAVPAPAGLARQAPNSWGRAGATSGPASPALGSSETGNGQPAGGERGPEGGFDARRLRRCRSPSAFAAPPSPEPPLFPTPERQVRPPRTRRRRGPRTPSRYLGFTPAPGAAARKIAPRDGGWGRRQPALLRQRREVLGRNVLHTLAQVERRSLDDRGRRYALRRSRPSAKRRDLLPRGQPGSAKREAAASSTRKTRCRKPLRRDRKKALDRRPSPGQRTLGFQTCARSRDSTVSRRNTMPATAASP